jgi:hypothetical protein
MNAINVFATNVLSSNPAHAEVYSMVHYVIKFVSDIQQIDGFLLGHIVESGVKHHNHNHIKQMVGVSWS